MEMGLKYKCPFCYKNFAFFHKLMFCAFDHLELEGEERGKQETHRHKCSTCLCIKRHSRLSEFQDPGKHGCKKQGRPFEIVPVAWTMDKIKQFATAFDYPEEEIDRLFLDYCTTRKKSRTKVCASSKSKTPPKVKFVFNKQSKTSLKMDSDSSTVQRRSSACKSSRGNVDSPKAPKRKSENLLTVDKRMKRSDCSQDEAVKTTGPVKDTDAEFVKDTDAEFVKDTDAGILHPVVAVKVCNINSDSSDSDMIEHSDSVVKKKVSPELKSKLVKSSLRKSPKKSSKKLSGKPSVVGNIPLPSVSQPVNVSKDIPVPGWRVKDIFPLASPVATPKCTSPDLLSPSTTDSWVAKSNDYMISGFPKDYPSNNDDDTNCVCSPKPSTEPSNENVVTDSDNLFERLHMSHMKVMLRRVDLSSKCVPSGVNSDVIDLTGDDVQDCSNGVATSLKGGRVDGESQLQKILRVAEAAPPIPTLDELGAKLSSANVSNIGKQIASENDNNRVGDSKKKTVLEQGSKPVDGRKGKVDLGNKYGFFFEESLDCRGSLTREHIRSATHVGYLNPVPSENLGIDGIRYWWLPVVHKKDGTLMFLGCPIQYCTPTDCLKSFPECEPYKMKLHDDMKEIRSLGHGACNITSTLTVLSDPVWLRVLEDKRIIRIDERMGNDL